jgi:hypothetical protein
LVVIDIHDSDQIILDAYTMKIRRGISLIETLFAIGVILVGLVGVASVLGTASRQASESSTMTEATVYGKNWSQEFVARQLSDRSKWTVSHPLIPNQTAIDSNVAFCFDPYGYVSNFSTPDIENWSGSGFNAGVTAVPRSVLISNNPDQYMHMYYEFSPFPYYAFGFNSGDSPTLPTRNFNPLLNPALPGVGAVGVTWTYPIIYRTAGRSAVLHQDIKTGSSAAPFLIPAEMAARRKVLKPVGLNMALSTDDISLYRDEKEKSLITSFFGDMVSMKRTSDGRYSFLVTFEPTASLFDAYNPNYSMSTVVIKGRTPTELSPDMAGQVDANLLPMNERLVWVLPMDGQLEAVLERDGGTSVVLVGNQSVDSHVRSGDFIFLRRFSYRVDPSTGQMKPYRIHAKWYAVTAVGEEQIGIASELGIVDPFSAATTGDVLWKRTVTINGGEWVVTRDKSWHYGLLDNPRTNRMESSVFELPTVGTLVKGVVAVQESPINLP